MRFHGDLTQASPVIRDILGSDSGVIAGQAVTHEAGAATGEAAGGFIDASTAAVDFLGVTMEAVSGTADLSAGTETYAKVIVNPCAYYLAQWDTTNGGTNTVANSTGEVITDTGIDAYQEGGWAYVYGPTTDTGYGNLIKIGAQTSTTALTNVTGAAYDDELKANTTSSTYIIIRKCFQGDPTLGGIDLDSTFAKLDGSIDSTGDMIVLENYISHKRFPMEPLRVAKHGGKNVPGAVFYSDLYFMDAFLRGSSTQA